MLDYKTIIIKRYALNMSGTQIAKDLGCSKSGVNDFLKRFEECKALSFPLPLTLLQAALPLHPQHPFWLLPF